jgi:hypothetical protein
MQVSDKKKAWVKKMLRLKFGNGYQESADVDEDANGVVLRQVNKPKKKKKKTQQEKAQLARTESMEENAEVDHDDDEVPVLVPVEPASEPANGAQEDEDDDDGLLAFAGRVGSSRSTSSKMHDSRAQAKKLLQWILEPVPVSDFVKWVLSLLLSSTRPSPDLV